VEASLNPESVPKTAGHALLRSRTIRAHRTQLHSLRGSWSSEGDHSQLLRQIGHVSTSSPRFVGTRRSLLQFGQGKIVVPGRSLGRPSSQSSHRSPIEQFPPRRVSDSPAGGSSPTNSTSSSIKRMPTDEGDQSQRFRQIGQVRTKSPRSTGTRRCRRQPEHGRIVVLAVIMTFPVPVPEEPPLSRSRRGGTIELQESCSDHSSLATPQSIPCSG